MELITQIKKVISNYNFGKLRKYEILSDGFANINYKITTPKGNFLYRICKQQTLEYINYELNLLFELEKIDIPIAKAIQRSDGNYVNETTDGAVVIYEFIEGEKPELNNESVFEIAGAVAKLSSFKNWNDFPRTNVINIDKCFSLIGKFDKVKFKFPEIFNYFEEYTNFLYNPLSEHVPIGIVHGDIFPDNTIFNNNKLLAIIDFEEACCDNLLFDVGMTINGFCFINNELNKELLNIFLKRYNEFRKIKETELELLPYYILWGAHGMLSWHLERLVNKENPEQLLRVKELMNRAILIKKNNFLN